jgi:hypothetical protein
MRSGNTSFLYPPGLSELTHLLGYFHQDVWDDFSTHEQVWEAFDCQERNVSIDMLLREVETVLARPTDAVHKVVQSNSSALYFPDAGGSRKWLESLQVWLVARRASMKGGEG